MAVGMLAAVLLAASLSSCTGTPAPIPSTVSGSAEPSPPSTPRVSSTDAPPPGAASAPTPAASTGTSTTGTSTTGTSTTGTPSTVTSLTPTPQTPNGLQTGPGVTDTTINLGVLVDPGIDRGFTAGLLLWQRSANTGGGICGRTIAFTSAGSDDVPANLPIAYHDIGRRVLGMVTLAGSADAPVLASAVGIDQIPALTPVGTSAELRSPGPVVIGPTTDILAINAFAYLDATAATGGGILGVVSDGSPDAVNALSGMRWAAEQAGVRLDIRGAAGPLGDWGAARAVAVFADPSVVAQVLNATAPGITVLTTLDGFQPPDLPRLSAGRLLVVTPTPVFGSSQPAVAAVKTAFTAAGGTNPGPRLLAGYATGVTWGRLLARSCTDRAITRSGVVAAMTEIGPAPIDGLLGPADPGLVVSKHLPASRLSAIAAADPSAPGGLKPLTTLQAADNIGSYTPGL